MTPRERCYHLRIRRLIEASKPIPNYPEGGNVEPAYQVTFGGTSHGKSLYSRLLKERYGFKVYGVDKEGAVRSLNPRQVQDTFEYWCKES